MPTDPTSWFSHGLGRPAAAAVVNDQTGPVVVPTLLCATICQKYVVFAESVDGVYDAGACPVVTCGGGFAVPELHVVARGARGTPRQRRTGADACRAVCRRRRGRCPGAEPPPDAVTATESNVAVLSCPVLWLVTTRPDARSRAERHAGAADRRPRRAVGRHGAGDRRTRSHELQPRRSRIRRAREPGRRSAVARARHELDAAAGLDVDDDVRRGRTTASFGTSGPPWRSRSCSAC